QGQEVIVSSTIDQTERRQVAEEMTRQREILHQSEKLGALGELLAGVAHELNNPLSVVVGQALMLREMAEDPVIAQRAEKIGKAADRCAKIVKTFLSMARQRPSDNAAISLNEVVDSALEVTTYSLRSADIEVQANLADDLPPVRGDIDQLNQVLTNLIVNAQNALQSYPGKRCLKINTFYRRARGEVVLKVKDSGPGIPEAIRSRIFEPFFTTKEVGAGTGIGLAFCHRIVEAHGGRIKVASRQGEGATFVIALPAKPRQDRPAGLAGGTAAPSAALRVLLIDDEADVREILSECLRGLGHEVELAESGGDALNLMGRNSYDVILSDLRMPGLDGPRLYTHLCDHAPELLGRLGFVTGDAMSPAVRSFLKTAKRPYIEKPANPDDLRDLIARLTGSTV
ncbi:MAG: ATP-binding protein, partial [Rhodovibrionaceae bacterium]